MPAPIPLRQDFEASQLRGLARRNKDGPQARRLLALAAIYDGATRTEAAKGDRPRSHSEPGAIIVSGMRSPKKKATNAKAHMVRSRWAAHKGRLAQFFIQPALRSC
jgi:hypothetical protein